MSKSSANFLWQVRKLPKYLLDRDVKFYKKITILLGVAYIISPIDALPEVFMPFVGWLDDLGVFGLLAMFLNKELAAYHNEIEPKKIQGE